MTSIEEKQIPSSWQISTLGEVCEKPEYGWTTSASETGSVKFLRTTDITKETLDWSRVPYCEKNPLDVARFRLTRGDIVVSRAGSVGVSALIGDCPNAVFASYLIRFRPLCGLDGKYAFYFLHSPGYWREIAAKSAGIALQNVNARKLAAIAIPICPEPEQGRIVAEIEKQFTRLDAAVAALKRVQANLKRYRASVLKAACEGRLVPKQGEWSETTIRESVKIIDYRGRTPPFAESGIPHLRSSNIKQGRVLWTGLAFVSEDTFTKYMTRGLPEPGDILFTTEAPLGEVAPAPTDQKFSVAQRIMILRSQVKELDPTFLMYQIMSPRFQAVLSGRGTGTTVTGVSSRNFRPAPILLPPLSEQLRIVGEVERLFSIIEEIDMQVDASLKRAERLRQSILKRAFEGKLVPQDPDDEPASVLLERIRAKRETRGEEQKGKRESNPKSGRKKEVASV